MNIDNCQLTDPQKDCRGWYVPWICGFCPMHRNCPKSRRAGR